MSWKQRKKLAEQRAKALNDADAILDAAEADDGRELTDEEQTQLDELETRAKDLNAKIDRHDRLLDLRGEDPAEDPDEPETRSRNTQSNRPGRGDTDAPAGEDDEDGKLETRAFRGFLRAGLGSIEQTEQRALTVAGQGVVGARPFTAQMFDKLETYVGVRQAGAEVISTSHGNEFTMPSGDDTANEGREVDEAATNDNETNPTLGNVKLGAHKISSDWIKVSHELIQDSDYDVEAYIRRKASERIGKKFNKLCTVGTGTGQPQGVVGGATLGKTAAANNAITYEEILDLVHSVDAAYRMEPGFRIMLHDTTLAAIRKLKDGGGAYIWSAGAAGAPNEILGYRYVVNNHMAELSSGAGSRVLLAGDFGRVIVRDVTSPVIIRAVEKFADDGLVGFKVDSRHDCRIGDSTAIKALQLAA